MKLNKENTLIISIQDKRNKKINSINEKITDKPYCFYMDFDIDFDKETK